MKIFKLTASAVAIIIMVFALSGCSITNNNETTTQTTTATTTQNQDETFTVPTSESTTAQAAVPTDESTTESPTTAESPEELSKLWARQDVNVREKPDTDSKKLGVLHEGNGIICVGKTSGGWSKVIFNGTEAYISSSYLTDKEPAKLVSSDRVLVDPYGENWNLIIVNTEREIPSDYVPQLAEVAGSGVYLDYRVAPHYNEMYAAAKKDGIILTPYSGYRSYARQLRNYNNLTNTYMSQYNLSREDAAAKAATVILPPGTSEHNLGIAMDICNTNSTFSQQKEYKWLMEHAHEYGFILRYTGEKQPVTGIIPEPWHWRYVGTEHAAAIKESGLCLEDYLEQNGLSS